MSDIKIDERVIWEIQGNIDNLVRTHIYAGLITDDEINRWLDIYYEQERGK